MKQSSSEPLEEKPFLTEEQIEKLTESKPRHDCELWVEEYFGLSPLIDENEKIDADYGQLVNLCTMVKEKLESQLSSIESDNSYLQTQLDIQKRITDGRDRSICDLEDSLHRLESELKALREERDFLKSLILKSESLNCNCATPNDCKELTNCVLKGRKPIP